MIKTNYSLNKVLPLIKQQTTLDIVKEFVEKRNFY